jgi:hypothetical protein
MFQVIKPLFCEIKATELLPHFLKLIPELILNIGVELACRHDLSLRIQVHFLHNQEDRVRMVILVAKYLEVPQDLQHVRKLDELVGKQETFCPIQRLHFFNVKLELEVSIGQHLLIGKMVFC